jgi:hypothetical protein
MTSTANPAAPPMVAIMLDRPRFLVFNLNALIALEEVTGQNMLDPSAWDKLFGTMRDEETQKVVGFRFSAKNVRALLYGGLLKDDPTMTLEKAGELVTPDNFGEVVAAILRAQNRQAATGETPRPTEAADAGENKAS